MNLLGGFAVGFLVATSGAIKDTMYEGFSFSKYARSIWLAVLFSFFIDDVFQIFFCERATTEVWKAFFRVPKEPGKFKGGVERDNLWAWKRIERRI